MEEKYFPFLEDDKMYFLYVPLSIEDVGREFIDKSFYDKLEKFFKPPYENRKDGFYVRGEKLFFSGPSNLEENIASYVALNNELLPETLIDYIVSESFDMTLFDLHIVRCLSTPSGKQFKTKYVCFDDYDEHNEAMFLQNYLENLLDVSE